MPINKNLFSEFESLGKQAWKEKVIQDLKGKDFDTLKTITPEGITIDPYYTKEDIDSSSIIPFLENSWLVTETILVKKLEEANLEALELLNKGVMAIRFDLQEKDLSLKEVETLLANIQIEIAPVYLRNCPNPETWLEYFQAYFAKTDKGEIYPRSSLGLDSLEKLTLTGTYNDKALKAWKEIHQKLNSESIPLDILDIDGSIFKESGGNLVQEIAFTLAKGVEYLNRLDINDVESSSLRFTMSTGSQYLMEIAKWRAFRLLWSGILKAFDIKNKATHLHAISARYNKTVLDPHVNMLRNTSEAMSAIVGGCDSLELDSYDTITGETAFGKRISRNIQSVLLYESYFAEVKDVAAGAYFIENMTKELAEKGWLLFLEVEKKGGFIKAFQDGFIAEQISQNRQKLENEVAKRKMILLGTNKFPKPGEFLKKSLPKTANKTLQPFRLAEPFETLRIKTETYFLKTGKRPSVFLLKAGNISASKVRADFATNFFACGGFETIDTTLEEGVKNDDFKDADYIVLCSDNESWRELVPKIYAKTGSKKFVLAGHPKMLEEVLPGTGVAHFIYEGCNMPETLERFLNSIVIK